MSVAMKSAVKVGKPESMVNDATREFDDSSYPVGSTAHQGDVVFARISSLPPSAKKILNRQLATGNTQGSRHILLPGPSVYSCDSTEVVQSIKRAFKGVEVSADLIGPVFVVESTAEVDHPEHGNHRFVGDMVIACVYQRNLDSEERIARVRD